jgi:3-oxoacyl-[acyl-carrier protein] reductase
MRNVVVTGGSRGLGLGIARRLTSDGYRAIAIARKSNDQLAAAMEETKCAQTGALDFVPFDFGDIDDIPELVKNLRREFGPI